MKLNSKIFTIGLTGFGVLFLLSLLLASNNSAFAKSGDDDDNVSASSVSNDASSLQSSQSSQASRNNDIRQEDRRQDDDENDDDEDASSSASSLSSSSGNQRGGDDDRRGRNQGQNLNAVDQGDDDNEIIRETQETLRILPNGNIRITSANLDSIETSAGTTTATSTPTGRLGISIFGIRLTVDASNARIVNSGATTTLADFRVGNKLSIKGTINSSTGLVSAQLIHNRTLRDRNVEDLQRRIQELLEMVRKLQDELRLRTSR